MGLINFVSHRKAFLDDKSESKPHQTYPQATRLPEGAKAQAITWKMIEMQIESEFHS